MTYKEILSRIKDEGLEIAVLHYIKHISFEVHKDKKHIFKLTSKQYDKLKQEQGLKHSHSDFRGITIHYYKIEKNES